MAILRSVYLFFRAILLPKVDLAAENLALRQQLAMLQRSIKRPRLRPRGRAFWVWLLKLWPDWRSALIVVKPETVVRWHRQGFRWFWRRRSRTMRRGRP